MSDECGEDKLSRSNSQVSITLEGNVSNTDNLKRYLNSTFQDDPTDLPQLVKKRPYLKKLAELLFGTMGDCIEQTISHEKYDLIIKSIRILTNEIALIAEGSAQADLALKKINSNIFNSLINLPAKSKDDYITKYNQAEAEKKQLLQENYLLQKKITSIEGKFDVLTTQHTGEVTRLENQILSLNAEIKALHNNEDSLKYQQSEMEKRLHTSIEIYKAIESKLSRKSQKLIEARKQISICNAIIADYENQTHCQTISEILATTQKPEPLKILVNPPQIDPRVTDLEHKLEKLTGELKQSQEQLQLKEKELNDSNQILNELQEQVNGLSFENDSLRLDLSATYEDTKRLTRCNSMTSEVVENTRAELQSYKNLVDSIRQQLKFHGDNADIPDIVGRLIKYPEEHEQQQSVINGLVNFSIKLIKGRSSEYAPLLISGFDEKELCDGLDGALAMVAESEDLPLFEAGAGSRKAAQKIVEMLKRSGNKNLLVVVVMLAAVNKRALEILGSIRKRMQTIKSVFCSSSSDLDDDNLIDEVINLIRRISPLMSSARRTLKNVFKRDIDDTKPAECFEVFMDDIGSMITNIETELRPIVGSDIDFVEIPAFVADIVSELHHELLDKANVSSSNELLQETELEEINKELQNAKKALTETVIKLKKVTARKSELKQKVEDQAVEISVLEQNNFTIKEQKESSDQRAECLKSENNSLKQLLESRSEQFDKRINELMEMQHKQSQEEMRRKERLHNQQMEVLEEQNRTLTEKIQKYKEQNREIQRAFDITLSRQRYELTAASAADFISARPLIKSLGETLDRCFKKSGEWDEHKIQRAVKNLVERALKYEKSR